MRTMGGHCLGRQIIVCHLCRKNDCKSETLIVGGEFRNIREHNRIPFQTEENFEAVKENFEAVIMQLSDGSKIKRVLCRSYLHTVVC